jgi:hypothetical protein
MNDPGSFFSGNNTDILETPLEEFGKNVIISLKPPRQR